MSDFIESFNYIKNEINKLDIMDGFKAIQKKICKKPDYKIDNSALSLFLQEIESKIFIVMKNYLEYNGCISRIPIHDALWFDDIKNICENSNILDDIKTEIKNELNLDIPLDFDDTNITNEDIEWFENHKTFYNNNIDKMISVSLERTDIIYAKNILKHFEDKCFSIGKGILVMYDDDTGLWSDIEGFHRKICLKHSKLLFPNIYDTDTKKSFDTLFNTAYKNLKSIAIKIDDWITNDKQIGYLLFQNGVLDMKNFKLLPFDPSYRFTKRINRDFDVNCDYTEGYNQIFDRLYNKQFTDNTKKQFFIEKLSRGVAGEYKDRQFVLGIGETSCGKGKQTLLLSNSFGEFICEFNGEELLDKKNTNSDTARELSYIADIFDCRISISNELEIKTDGKGKFVKVNGLNCNRIKKMTGNDRFMIRKLYVNPYAVINKSMPILLLNDIPEVNGVDDAYIKRANYITYDRCSSTLINDDNDTHFVADDKIDDFINEPYIIDSYVYLICIHYKNSIENRLIRPECVITISKQMSGYNDNNEEYFRNNYKITDAKTIESWIIEEKNNKGVWRVDWSLVNENYIECSKMYKTYLESGYSGSNILFGKKLFKIGIISSVKKINGRSNNVYVGITDNNE